jgi:hypothetical protein
MNDDYVWNMVAFLKVLPKLDQARYQSMVARSGGHSHGGGETHGAGEPDDHGGGEGEHHHDQAENPVSDTHAAVEPAGHGTVHTHADGKQHTHLPTGGNK